MRWLFFHRDSIAVLEGVENARHIDIGFVVPQVMESEEQFEWFQEAAFLSLEKYTLSVPRDKDDFLNQCTYRSQVTH